MKGDNMRIIIKGLKGFEIYPENKAYIEKRFSKYEELVKEPAVFEFSLEHTHKTRANIDKKVSLTFTMPGFKNPEHLEEISEHFPESIDKIDNRFEEIIMRHREKEQDRERKQIK